MGKRRPSKQDIKVAIDMKFVKKMQPLVDEIYKEIWPDCKVIDLENEDQNILKNIIDVGGADKLLKYPDGTITFLAQRLRRWESYHKESIYYGKKEIRDFDDFTLREYRPLTHYKAECYKVLKGIGKNRFFASYYAYGHVNKNKTEFERFRIVDFKHFVELWSTDKLPLYKRKWNKDESSYFLAWPFRDLPRKCIYWKKKINPLFLNKTLLEKLSKYGSRKIIPCPYCKCNFLTKIDLKWHSTVCFPWDAIVKELYFG